MNNKDFSLALLVVALWGANFTVVKLGLDGVPPMLLAALRFVFAVFPAIFFVARPTVKPIYWITYGLLIGVGMYGTLFFAMTVGMPAGIASVVLQSQAFFTLLLAGLFLKESFSVIHMAGLAIAAIGLYFVGCYTTDFSVPVIPPVAFLLTITGAVFWGLSNILVRKAVASATANGEHLNIMSLIVWSSLIPPIPLFLLAVLLDTPQTISSAILSMNRLSIFSILYLAYGATLFGFGLWSTLLARHPASKVAPLSLLVPVFGLLTARIVLGEHLTISQWSGCLLVIIGLLVSMFGRQFFKRPVFQDQQ
jgi:O-acetylserine/cysteine efflux transporter